MTLKERIFKKANIWHLVAVAVFLLIACAYFYPALDGYVVKQGDVKNWVGSAQEIKDYRESGQEIGWTNSMFGGMPTTQISVIYPGRGIVDFLKSAMTLWLPNPISTLFLYFIGFYIMAISFRVKPLVAIAGAIAFGLSSYFIIIIEVGHNTKATAVGFATLLIAGFIFAYRWKNWILGVALSALFMAFELAANHLQVTYYVIFILIALGATELRRHLALQGGINKFLKVTGGLLVAYVLAVMVNYGNIFGTLEYADETTRGGTELTILPDGSKNTEIKTSGLDKDYVTGWSYGKAETFTFIVPNFKGGASGYIGNNKANEDALKKADSAYRSELKKLNQYWGDQPGTSGPVYLGVIVVLLAILALVYSKEKSRWPIFAVTIFTVMLSWGKNFMGFTDIFLDYLPGYNKFRAVTIILVIAAICVPLLGVFFLQKIYEARDEIQKNLKPFYITVGVFTGILLLFAIVPSAFNSFLSTEEQAFLDGLDVNQAPLYEDYFNQLVTVRMAIFTKDVWRSVLFVILGAGVIYAYLRSLLSKEVFIGILAVLLLADLMLVDMRYLATEKSGKRYSQWIEKYKQDYPYLAGDGEKQILGVEIIDHPELAEKIDSAIFATNESLKGVKMEGAEKQRLMDWATYRTMNRYTHFRVKEEGNPFNSAYTSYFNKSLGGYHGAKLSRYQDLIEFHLAYNNPAVLDMLNAKYTLRPVPDKNTGEIDNSMLISVNRTAMGNAWFAKKVEFVENADSEIMALKSSNTYRMKAFGNHELLVNGMRDTVGIVRTYDLIKLVFVSPADSSGFSRRDTIDVQVPFQAVTKELPLAFVLTEKGVTWDYVVNVDSTKIPLLAVDPAGRDGWDPSQVTIADQRYKTEITQTEYSGSGSVELVSYNPDHMVYDVSTTEKQLVVFSEIYYEKGWKAYVDNAEVPISRVNYLLRAIEIPATAKRIELVYKSPAFEKSGNIAWAGSIALILFLGFGIFTEVRSSGKEDKESAES